MLILGVSSEELNERKYALMSSVDELQQISFRLTLVITNKLFCSNTTEEKNSARNNPVRL